MYDILTDPGSGAQTAADAETGRRVMVLPDGGKGRLFKRRAIKQHADGRKEDIEWLVAELDGVRTYFDGDAVVVSRRDLYP